MITKLNFKNLRYFEDFTLDGITPVTLISGKNNVGKSTLLEGIFLLFGHQNPGIFFQLNAFRGDVIQTLNPKVLWEPLFKGLDTTRELSISAAKDDVEYVLRLQKNEQSAISTSVVDKANETQDIIKPVVNSYPLKITYCESNGYKNAGNYHVVFPNISINLESPLKPIKLLGCYIGSHSQDDPNVISEQFGGLELNGQKQRLIEALLSMDEKIADLFTVVSSGTGYIYAKTVSGMKIPLRSMGEGMNKLLSITLTMLANPGCVLLLDEVENGFHHSFHEKFWKLLFKLSAETNCQIFATTHSYECISGAIDAAVDSPNGEALSYVRLGLKNGEVVPHVFSKDLLAYALSSEMEVR
jgi:AAA15 family ATPase/GTPase